MTNYLQLVSERKSIAYFHSQDLHPNRDPWPGFYSHMFIEDIRLGIMPIGGNSRNHPNFMVTIDHGTSGDDDILRNAFSIHGNVCYTLKEAVSEFISDCAMNLVHKSEIHYEIVLEEPNKIEQENFQAVHLPTNTVRLFRPVLIPGTIIKIGRYYFQLVPRPEWPFQKKLAVGLSAANIWTIKLPAQLGNRASHTRFLRALMRQSPTLPGFVKFDVKDDSSRRDFSFNEFHKNGELRIAMETSLWGWPARQLFEKSSLEYYHVYRLLRFSYSMAILREHLLLSINDLLTRINFSSHLSIVGLPTSYDLKDAIHKLELGNLSFDDALMLTNLL